MVVKIQTPEELSKSLPAIIEKHKEEVLSDISKKLDLGLTHVEVSSKYYRAMPTVVEHMRDLGWKVTYCRDFPDGPFMDIYWTKLNKVKKPWWKFW